MSKEIADRLQSLVDSKYGGNWAEIARLSKLTPSTLQPIKQGKDARGSTLLRISEALGISLDWLIAGEEEMYRGESGALRSANAPYSDLPDWLEIWLETASDKEMTWLEIQIKLLDQIKK